LFPGMEQTCSPECTGAKNNARSAAP